MKFEYLANEVLLDLFEFFDGIQLIHAFHNLNSRFNTLLFTHLRIYHFDFRTISKPKFDLICQRYLPSIIDRIISLHLSEDDETPNLPNLLLSHGFTLNQFNHLHSLFLHYIYSYDLLNEIILQCSHLPYFTHLTIIDCYLFTEIKSFYNLINNIWKLPKLIYSNINTTQLINIKLTKLSIISRTLKTLLIENIICDFYDLSHLIKYTPNLQRLCLSVFKTEQIQNIIPSIISLKLLYKDCITSMIDLFQKLPNLVCLTLETWYIYLNGNEWKNILIDYLSNLKHFRLKMNFNFSFQMSIEQQIDELLETFRIDFWILKQRQYFRCDWDSLNRDNSAILYTLPYAFKEFIYSFKSSSKSTCPNENDYWLYDHVQYLRKYQDMNLFPAKFSNIRYLKIRLSDYLSEISIFNQLISIELTFLNQDSAYSQLQILFDLAPRLYSLKICYSKDFQMKRLQMKSSSIRRLDFMEKSLFNFHYFNRIDCIDLTNSSLGLQCEVLSIGIENRDYIFDLINKMSNLRALTFRCKDDKSSSNNDELIQWLKYHLPSTYTILRKNKEMSVIRLWIA